MWWRSLRKSWVPRCSTTRHGDGAHDVVRTSALVTNLGVHFKLGRENALAWVTTLDKGQPVAGATVQVSDCNGKPLASATTNAQGMAEHQGLSPERRAARRRLWQRPPTFVSARASIPAPGSGAAWTTMAFTWSDWQRGIEPWRFNVPTSQDPAPDQRAHTVFDRTLLRAGETVSMKHLLRLETSQGFGLPPRGWPGHAGHHPCGQRPAVHPAPGLAQHRHRAA
jgi:uncharacterized protein YfaS (alpha-2-macroglobulin family)